MLNQLVPYSNEWCGESRAKEYTEPGRQAISITDLKRQVLKDMVDRINFGIRMKQIQSLSCHSRFFAKILN